MADEPMRSERASERCEQILDAASECFAREGFHGTSIAQISKRAGMSPGHIYHFFENKEAIVTGIVERIVHRWIELLEPFAAEPDILDAMIERVDIGLEHRTDSAFAGLWLEVLAEAARNPQVAEAVRTAAGRMRTSLTRLVIIARESRGIEQDLREHEDLDMRARRIGAPSS